MSKKDWRKPRAIKGTIFDSEGEANTQRRCGLFYLHGVNPAAVARGGTSVESLGDGRVRVYYEAIYLPDGKSQWDGVGVTVPGGIECHHGGYAKRHPVKQIRHFDAALYEVL